MTDNKVCEGCKYARKFPAPYTTLCDYPFSRNVRMHLEEMISCDKREGK